MVGQLHHMNKALGSIPSARRGRERGWKRTEVTVGTVRGKAVECAYLALDPQAQQPAILRSPLSCLEGLGQLGSSRSSPAVLPYHEIYPPGLFFTVRPWVMVSSSQPGCGSLPLSFFPCTLDVQAWLLNMGIKWKRCFLFLAVPSLPRKIHSQFIDTLSNSSISV